MKRCYEENVKRFVQEFSKKKKKIIQEKYNSVKIMPTNLPIDMLSYGSSRCTKQ